MLELTNKDTSFAPEKKLAYISLTGFALQWMKNTHMVGSAIEMASQREVVLSSQKVKHTEDHVFCSEHLPMSQGARPHQTVC